MVSVTVVTNVVASEAEGAGVVALGGLEASGTEADKAEAGGAEFIEAGFGAVVSVELGAGKDELEALAVLRNLTITVADGEAEAEAARFSTVETL